MNMRSSWKRLAESAIMNEERQYRGDTYVTLSDLNKLLVGKPERNQPGVTGRPADPQGGVASGNYKFDPSILNLGDTKSTHSAWYDDLDTALINATTQSRKEVGAGRGTGGTMTKGNYGGKVQMSMAPSQPHQNDRLGSTMDRYDVIIVADFENVMNRKGEVVPQAFIKRVVYAPSMGSADERSARLQSLLAGKSIDLPRRAQGERPSVTKGDEKKWAQARADAAARHGGSNADDEEKPSLGSAGGTASNSDFAQRLAKHNKAYQPGAQRARDDQRGPGLFDIPDEPPGQSTRMAGPKKVRTYPGGIATDRHKLRRFRNLPRPKIPADED